MAGDRVTLARLRRDRWAIWLCVPAGLVVMWGLAQAWDYAIGEPPRELYTTLDVIWIVIVFLLIWQHSSRRCPHCGHRFLRAFPWMSLKRVKCGHCGYELK
jgi:DNA-directed RNA polymerase subunit RPC12/RpoP